MRGGGIRATFKTTAHENFPNPRCMRREVAAIIRPLHALYLSDLQVLLRFVDALLVEMDLLHGVGEAHAAGRVQVREEGEDAWLVLWGREAR